MLKVSALSGLPIFPFPNFRPNCRTICRNGGGSIAFGRGEDLTSKSLSKSLESLFSITTPSVREGAPLTWTRLVLFAGPQFEGPAQFKVGNSSVELSENDLKLLRSGRPWRFLFPWPDKDDCKKELQSNDTVLQELVDARKTIGEGECLKTLSCDVV